MGVLQWLMPMEFKKKHDKVFDNVKVDGLTSMIFVNRGSKQRYDFIGK